MNKPPDERAEDPRFQRVCAALRSTVLELSSTDPVESISVARVSEVAGVHRTSFYSHASSPVELLVTALASEFEPVFDALLAEDLEPAVFWTSFYRVALQEVKSRKQIWIVAVRSGSAMLGGMQRVFKEAAAEAFPHVMGDWRAEDTGLWLEVALQQTSSNLMALITAWSLEGLKTPVEDLVGQYRTLAPPWQLAHRDEDGRITMARRK